MPGQLTSVKLMANSATAAMGSTTGQIFILDFKNIGKNGITELKGHGAHSINGLDSIAKMADEEVAISDKGVLQGLLAIFEQ